MFKPLKYFIFLVFALIILLLVIPYFIPLEKYKDDIISEVKKSTGRDLTIDGKISLSILPRPSVSLRQVKLSSKPGFKEPLMADIEMVSASIDILPLITGNVVVSAISLNNPKINLEVMKNGKNNWTFAEIKENNDKEKAQTDFDNLDEELPFIVKYISITNGQISYIEPKDKIDIEDIDIKVAIKSWHGPVDFNIDLQALHNHFNLTGTVQKIGKVIPIEAKLTTLHDNLNIIGELDTKSLNFAGNINADGDIDGLKNPFNLVAKLNVNKKNLLIKDINFSLGKVKAMGEFKYIFGKNIIILNFKSKPGGVSVSLGKDKIFKLKAESLEPILTALDIDSKEFPPIVDRPFTFSSKIKPKGNNIIFDNINFIHKNSSIKGKVAVDMLKEGTKISYDLVSNNTNRLLGLFSRNIDVNFDKAKSHGTINKNGSKIKTDIKLSSALVNVAAKGEIDISASPDIEMKVSVAGDNLNKTLQKLFKSSPNKLGKFLIVHDIKGNINKKLRVQTLESMLQIGSNDIQLRGDTEITMNASKPRVLSNIIIDTINLDDLTSNQRSAANISQSQSGSSFVSNQKWSRQKIDLSCLGLVNGEFNIKVNKFVNGIVEVEHVLINFLLSNSTLELKSLTADLFGGELTAAGKVSDQSSRLLDFKASIKQAELKNMKLKELGFKKKKLKITEGTLDVNLDLKSSGKSEYDYVSNLFGNIEFDSTNGTLKGIDLSKIGSSFKNIKDLRSVGNNFKEAFFKGSTKFEKLTGVIKFSNGISANSRFKLKSDVTEAEANGTIDLPGYKLNIIATIDSAIKNIPAIKIKFYGPLDNPKQELDLKDLYKHFIKNAVKESTKDITKDIKKNVIKDLGGKDKKKVIKELKGLFK